MTELSVAPVRRTTLKDDISPGPNRDIPPIAENIAGMIIWTFGFVSPVPELHIGTIFEPLRGLEGDSGFGTGPGAEEAVIEANQSPVVVGLAHLDAIEEKTIGAGVRVRGVAIVAAVAGNVSDDPAILELDADRSGDHVR